MPDTVGEGSSDFSTVHEVFEDYLQRLERGEEPRINDVVGDRPELLPRIEKLMSTMLRLEGGVTPGTSLEQQPQVLGDYRIVREIGQGGMGIVYEAEQVSLGRRIALKVITSARNTSAAAVTRFRREAAVASRLDHPGLCAVYDAGTEDGTPYIAMAFVPGRTLAQIIKIRQSDLITPETIMDRTGMLRIVEDVARALHHAHECGVIHRDVKPANIMIRQDGSPVVLDFGLARSLDDGDPTLTLTGDVLGTPAYMSPEQLRGEPTDRRCDVWALGVILY